MEIEGETLKESLGRRLVLVTLLVILLFGSAMAFVSPPSAAASAPVNWQSPYHFRREISVFNPGMTLLTNYPILLNVNFSEGRVLSAVNEIRLFDSAGDEVPSYVVAQQSSGGFVASATLLAFLNLPPDSNTSLWLYYGYPAASTPTYREGSGASSPSLGPVSVTLGSANNQSYVTFTYAGTYSTTTEPVVSYGSPVATYGSPALGGGLLSVANWQTLGNATRFGASVVSATFRAGSLTYNQVEIATTTGLISFDRVSNLGSMAVSNVGLSLVFNESQLASLASLGLSYSENSSLQAATVNGTFVEAVVSPIPGSHDIGPSSALIADALSGGTSGVNSTAPAAGAIVSWPFGALPPGGSVLVKTVLGITSGLGTINQSILVSPTVQMGEEQTSSGYYFPSITGIWAAGTSMVNESIPEGGVIFPLQVKGGTILPGSFSLSGTVSYSLPSAAFSSGNEGDWTVGRTAEGDSVAYASPSFYSVTGNSYMGRISVSNGDVNGSSTAYLASPDEVSVKSNSTYLAIKYKASVSFSQGEPAKQDFYAAVNVFNAETGALADSVYFPVSGTSASINYTGTCGQTPVSGPIGGTLSSPKAEDWGYLIGDSTWRVLNVNVSNVLSAGGSEFQLLLCASTSRGFVGQMELQTESAAVSFILPASRALGAFSTSSGIQLLPTQGISAHPTVAAANISLGFDIASTLQMSQGSEPSFFSQVPKANVTVGGGLPPGAGKIVSEVQGIIADTPFVGQHPQFLVNGTSVAGVDEGGGVLFVPGSTLASAGLSNLPESAKLQLVYQGAFLSLDIMDTGGNPLAGAAVTIAGQGSGVSITKTAASDGGVDFDVIPWNYTVSVVSMGSNVYASSINVVANQTAKVSTSVYQTIIKATDALGSPLSGSSLSISGNGFNETLPMPLGVAAIQIPSNVPYSVTVTDAGSLVYSGTLTASTNGAAFRISTSYIPQSVVLAAGAVAAAALVMMAILLYKPWNRFRPKQVTSP